MAPLTLMRPVEVSVVFLKAECGVRYWEDAEVNGKQEDDDNPTIPCRTGDSWCPVIALDTGKIEGWPEGVTAKTHYKVCDAGRYSLLDAERVEVGLALRCSLDLLPEFLDASASGVGGQHDVGHVGAGRSFAGGHFGEFRKFASVPGGDQEFDDVGDGRLGGGHGDRFRADDDGERVADFDVGGDEFCDLRDGRSVAGPVHGRHDLLAMWRAVGSFPKILAALWILDIG